MPKPPEIRMARNTQHSDRITQLDLSERNHQMTLRMDSNPEMGSASHPCVLCVSCSRDRVIVQGGRVNRFAGCCACENADCNIVE